VRVKEGEAPVSATERKEGADSAKATAVEQRTEGGSTPAPQNDKSYVATPTKPEEGRATPDAPTTPVAGTPPSDLSTRRDGSENKPDVVIDRDKKS